MKRYFLIILLIFGITTFYSCKQQEVGPILEDITASVLTSSATGDLVLLEEDSLEIFSDFAWTEAQANLDISMSYSLEMDTAEDNFTDPVILDFSDPFMYSPTVKEMNDLLISAGFIINEVNSLEYRVVTSANGLDPIYSNSVALGVTPYETIIDYGEVFLLGDATIPGWDNMAALPTVHLGSGVFQIETTLTANLFFKFIAVLGQWAPQWGTDATGTWEAGPLVYRPTEDIPDPDAIPSPPTDGDYVITADIVNLSYTVVAAK